MRSLTGKILLTIGHAGPTDAPRGHQPCDAPPKEGPPYPQRSQGAFWGGRRYRGGVASIIRFIQHLRFAAARS